MLQKLRMWIKQLCYHELMKNNTEELCLGVHFILPVPDTCLISGLKIFALLSQTKLFTLVLLSGSVVLLDNDES